MMSINVRSVQTELEIDRFVRFSWEVYRGNPLWVPPIIRETKKFLSGKGLFFQHCRHRVFRACEGSKTVATLASFYDRNLVDRWQKPIGLFGFFEALPEKEKAVKALFEEAEKFLREQGAEVIWGPVNGGIANPSGLLANAYNQSPVFMMMYNPSYYHAYLRRLGYYPLKELIAFTMDLMDGRLRRKIGFLLRRAQRSEVCLRPFNRKDFRAESDRLAWIYGTTFKHHWGYSPTTADELFELLEPLKLAIDPDFILFAQHGGDIIGFTLAVPDYSPVIKRLNGNLDGLSGLTFLHLKRKIYEGRLIAIGVVPEWRGKGVSPLLVSAAYDAMMRKGYTKCEYSWVFRENLSSQNVARKFDSDAYKHYYVYERHIKEDGKRFLR